jgi:hypothetical protein
MEKRKFCACVKAVRRTVKLNKKYAQTREGAAIAICTKAILFPRGKTIKKFNCLKKKGLFKLQSRKALSKRRENAAQ